MIEPASPGFTLSLVHDGTESTPCESCGVPGPLRLTGRVQVALIPDGEFAEIRGALDEVAEKIKSVRKERRNLLTEGMIQSEAASCDQCDLCMVCAGKHYTYSRDFAKCWPPGQHKCFAFLSKSGRMLRESPCSLCATHDSHLRTSLGDRRRSMSAEAALKTELARLEASRSALLHQHGVEVHVFR